MKRWLWRLGISLRHTYSTARVLNGITPAVAWRHPVFTSAFFLRTLWITFRSSFRLSGMLPR